MAPDFKSQSDDSIESLGMCADSGNTAETGSAKGDSTTVNPAKGVDTDPSKGDISFSTQTSEFSFILRTSQYGIGVFATHAIQKGTFLRLFGDRNISHQVSKECSLEDVPESFRMYCLHRNGSVICPADFGRMEIGWFLNHSHNPNAHHVGYDYFASRDIAAGEEITIDYNSLEEPEESKDDYYR